MRSPWLTAVLAALMSPAYGCGHMAPFVWVESLDAPSTVESSEYVIAAGDVINIKVWEQDKMSTKARVRADGKISFPLLHDITVAGKTPAAVATDLEASLKAYILTPVVNVEVEEPRSLKVSVLGKVMKPGEYVMTPGAGVAQVLAAAGGPNPFARKDRIFVVRASGPQQRIRFRYQSILEAANAAGRFKVRDGDVVIVD
jgi:polysaccharide export outer membrane protein